MKKLIKYYLRSLNRNDRELRLVFRGKRLIVKQYSWLHHTAYPWEAKEPEQELTQMDVL